MTSPVSSEKKSVHQIAQELKDSGMGCNCDLDNWEPERESGHSWVCRIHKAAIEKYRRERKL